MSYQRRKAVAAALKPIYQAADADAARVELEAFKASDLGQRYPNTVATFENAWERLRLSTIEHVPDTVEPDACSR